MSKKEYTAALYLRLSKDDDKQGESSSITTQRKILTEYAKENGFGIYDEYVDDGYTGTNFERPEFKRMIKDIENKKVNLVITKDLSRLGRDYITTGEYTEIYFPSKNVRYIAINDGYDSESQYKDIIPFKNIINEMYARDTSKKIRSSLIAKMRQGNFIGNFAPYGYKKDTNDKNHLVPDYESSEIVRKIFDMAYNGALPSEIAEYLNENKILTPIEYRCKNFTNLDVNNYSKFKKWTSGTITKMLRNRVYIGDMQQGKTKKISFKLKRNIINPKEDWITVRDTHEAIIEKNIFESVQSYSMKRQCRKKDKFNNIFSGIAKCMDCGYSMSTVVTRKKGSKANLSCGKYKVYGAKECTNHFIDYEDLYNLILKIINDAIKLEDADKMELYKNLLKSKNNNHGYYEKIKNLKLNLYRIDKTIEEIYQDKLNKVISENRFEKLLNKYESEGELISKKINSIIEIYNNNLKESKEASYENFCVNLDDYININELDAKILMKLVHHIEIGQGKYEILDGEKIKRQSIKIYLRFKGINRIDKYII